MGTERVVVLSSVADTFTQRLKEVYEDRYADVSKQTPVTQELSVQRIRALSSRAASEGAEILYGGKQDASNPRRFQPTIFVKTENTAIYDTESFAPFLAIVVANTVEAAIKVANDGEYGLSSAIWTRDLYKGLTLARRINTGYVFSDPIQVRIRPNK